MSDRQRPSVGRSITRRAAVNGIALSLYAAAGGIRAATAATGIVAAGDSAWWKNAVVYEIYPRSFQDTNGDGIGDFRGMTARLGYLAGLGVDAILVGTCFDSPNVDNGYDVRDYRKVMSDFGTMADFDAFLAAANRRGIRIILDMAFNHTSDEHAWFKASRASREDPYRDYYIWRDGKDGKPPTNWASDFSPSAWEFDARTNQYFLHTFSTRQPDLNWENPAVRRELYAVLKFWVAKGVSGFRFDAIVHIAKPAPFRDLTAAEGPYPPTGGPKLDAYLHEMHRDVFAGTSLYAVAEAWGVPRAGIIALTDDRRGEMSSAFRTDFQLVDIDDWKKGPWSLASLRAFDRDNAFGDDAHVWPLVYLENHDFPRAVSRYGSTNPAYHDRSATLLATLLLSLKGTPFVYQGQEIGMTNYPFTRLEQFDDIGVKSDWRDLVQTGKVPAERYLRNVAQSSRDNARTPMQWDATAHAGFTTAAKTSLAVNPNYPRINVATESADPHSVLAYYRRMIALRKRTPALVHGSYRDITGDHAGLYAYVRGDAVCVILNFSDHAQAFRVPSDLALGSVLIANLLAAPATDGRTIALEPWHAAIFTLRPQRNAS